MAITIDVALKGIGVAIFIVIVALVTLDLVTNEESQLLDLWDEVLTAKEEPTPTQTVEATSKLLTNLEEYCYSDTITKNSCKCYTQTPGVVSEGYYLSISNTDTTSTITVVAPDGTLSPQETTDFKLGLLYSYKEDNGEYGLGCIYPSAFHIGGATVGGEWYKTIPFTNPPTKNVWKVIYNGKYYGFYVDSNNEKLKIAPAYYRTSSDNICILTSFVEESLEMGQSGESNFGVIKENPDYFGLDIELDSVSDFLNSKEYCHSN